MTCAKSGAGELLTARCDCGHVYAAHSPDGCSICAAVAQLLDTGAAYIGRDEHLVLRVPANLRPDHLASILGGVPPELHGRVLVVTDNVEAYVVSAVPGAADAGAAS